MDFRCSRIFSQSIRRNLQYLSVLKYWMKPGYNSSRLWYLWLVVTSCTSIQTWVNAVRECEDFPDGHLVPRVISAFLRSERWVGKYLGIEVTLDGSWCIQSTVSLKQAAQLRLQLNQGCWDVIYECGCYFHPLKQNLYLRITLVIRLATRSGARAPHRFYWWLIWKLSPLVVAILEFYPFQRLFIRTKFLEVVDGLILAETSLLIMLSGMQI